MPEKTEKTAEQRALYINQERSARVGNETREPGDLLNEARDWARPFVATSHGRLVALSPESCAAIVREALMADPKLAADIATAAQSPAPAEPATAKRK